MANSRMLHTAALLADGTVLAIGGVTEDPSGNTGLSAVDQYTAGTPRIGGPLPSGTWTSAPSMLDQRAGHTSTVLQDGSVLVAGGADFVQGGALNTAELYTLLPDLSGCTFPFAMMVLVFSAGAALALRW